DGKRAFFWLKQGKPDPRAIHWDSWLRTMPKSMSSTRRPSPRWPSSSRRRCESSKPMPMRCWWSEPSSCGTTLDPTRPRSLLSSMMRSEQNNEVNMESNKQTVLKVLKGAFIERDATVVDRYFSPDYVQHNPV